MSSISVDLGMRMNAKEVFTAGELPIAASEAERTLKLNVLAHSTTLNGSSTPKVDKPPVYKKISAAGTTTIDLTAAPAIVAPGSSTRSVDMSGAKVKGYLIRCGEANAGLVTIAPGASNPYPLFGTGNEIDLGAGAVIAQTFDGVESNLPAVAALVKEIDVTTTGTDEVEIELILGT